MPSYQLTSASRRLLGAAGALLGDGDYAQVVAALGATHSGWHPPSGESWKLVAWSTRTFLENRRAIGVDAPRGIWLAQRDNWNNSWKAAAGGRLLVQLEPPGAPGPELAEVMRVLAHPALGAESLFIDWPCAHADLRWQWPMRLGAFPGDFEALQLGRLRDVWPARNLVAPVVLSRDEARVEVLVLRADARRALARLLALEHRVRAGFLLLLAPLDAGWRSLRPQLEALLAETQAGGAAIASLAPKSSFADTINKWANEMSHNVPFDHALGKAVPATQSLVAMDLKLIHAAALPVQAQMVGRRLKGLPQEVALRDLEGARDRIKLAWTRAKPPASLGAELEARAAAGDLPYDSEDHAASAVAEIAEAEREAERDLAGAEAPRYLQGDIYWLDGGAAQKELRGLAVGERYALDLCIGEKGLGSIRAEESFPDEKLEWKDGEALTLQVLFAEPQQWDEPMRGTLELERSGTSSTCRFDFSPTREGPFAGRVTLYYRGRILQTALLETTVVDVPSALPPADGEKGGMRLRVEAEIHRSLRTLDERRRFDACLVCNHTTARKAALTAAGKDGAYIASLEATETAVSRIGELLTQVAHDSRKYGAGLRSDANAKLLTDLAYEGNVLYVKIVKNFIGISTSADQVKTAEYLQIVTMTPEAMVPLEFVYEYALPDDGAPVCPNAAEALAKGRCPDSCRPTRSPAPHVCPMGFWGLSKVIERHLHVPELRKLAKVVGQKRNEPITGRDKLSLKGATLIAASKEVTPKKQLALDKAIRSIRGGVVEKVNDWARWQEEVESKKPVMLIVLPHAGKSGLHTTLEIGGHAINSQLIDEGYVHVEGTPPPVALLLGCDTANSTNTEKYLSHVDVFREANAALVLGTVAIVLGDDAADMAETLVKQLMHAVKAKPARFGEALRDSKRKAVGESEMVALCLLAFGDADWKLVA